MTAQVLVVFNQAGGVGKSTLTLNLGAALATRRRRVLLVDTDPQASLSLFAGVEPADQPRTLDDALRQRVTPPVVALGETLHLVPAGVNLTAFELGDPRLPPDALRGVLAGLLTDYALVLIDSPPSLGPLATMALAAAAGVLVPIQCQYKAYRGTDLLLHTVARVRRELNRHLRLVGFVPMMFDGRNVQDRRTLASIEQQLASVAPIFPPIPRATAFADATAAGRSLVQWQPSHPGALAVGAVARRLWAALEG